jgi:hypothetical protein
MPLNEAETWLDHLGSCSPCYRGFLQLQTQHRQRRTRMIFAVAASVLIVVGLATWAMLRQHDQRFARAVVDLRDRSISRGTEPPPTEPPIEIGRDISALDIYLPLGPATGLTISVSYRGTVIRSSAVMPSRHSKQELRPFMWTQIYLPLGPVATFCNCAGQVQIGTRIPCISND